MKTDLKILIVDDDPDDRQFFMDAVGEIDSNIFCFSAKNGAEAIKILDEEFIPDYIFLDLNMPKMDGKSCLKHIKASPTFRHIPVVIYSTSKRKEDVEELSQTGAFAFIIKPTKFAHLKNAITSVLSKPPGLH